MEEMNIEEIKNIQLGLLDFLDKFCRKNNIEYSLAGGSLLGAVRHQGFIPWDDDIDILLVRKEYEKLVQLLQEVPEPYHLHHYKTDQVFQPFSKFYDTRTLLRSKRDQMYNGRIGVHVDIFPYDVMPENVEQREKFIKEVLNLQENMTATAFPAFISGSKWYYQLIRLFLRFPRFVKYHGKSRELSETTNKFMQQYEDTDMKERGWLASRYIQKEHFPREIFDIYEDTHFEQLVVRKIKNHDIYLKQLYGDYMKFPPQSQRFYHSFYKWFWKSE
ncbi:MAG: LicD family protein [Streptococcaceae bacterium]|nr:LicD family protein [Streptococcaceae bacterium]